MGTGHLCYRYRLGWRSGTFSVKAFIQRWRKYTTGYTRGQTKDKRQTTKPGFVVHPSSLARISLECDQNQLIGVLNLLRHTRAGQVRQSDRERPQPDLVTSISLIQAHFKLDELLLQAFGQAITELLKMLFNVRYFGFPVVYINPQQFLNVFLWDVQAG